MAGSECQPLTDTRQDSVDIRATVDYGESETDGERTPAFVTSSIVFRAFPFPVSVATAR